MATDRKCPCGQRAQEKFDDCAACARAASARSIISAGAQRAAAR